MSNDIWTNEINAYREWEWEGNEPLNHRLMRFIGVAELGHQYNVTFASQAPTDIFQKI